VRILVTTDQWSPDVVGGSARVATDTARALARRGHEVVAVAPASAETPRLTVEHGVEVHRVVRRGHLPQTFVDPILTRRAVRPLLRRGFDVALTHQATNGSGIAGLGLPQAAVFHASAVLEMRFLRERVGSTRALVARGLDPALVRLERRWLTAAGTHLVLSRFSAELLGRQYPALSERVAVVGGGVDDSFFAPPMESATVLRERLGIPPGLLLFTARRLEPRMGVDVLVDAVGRLDSSGLALAVAGDGPERADLARQVEAAGLRGRVLLLGRVSEADLRGLYAAADLFVLPTVAYEGFGMSTVEALAQGTPALGTDAGATPEILTALGDEFVVPHGDADALAAGIARLLPLLGPELRARARALAVERYSWDNAIVRWEEAIRGGIIDHRKSAANLSG